MYSEDRLLCPRKGWCRWSRPRCKTQTDDWRGRSLPPSYFRAAPLDQKKSDVNITRSYGKRRRYIKIHLTGSGVSDRPVLVHFYSGLVHHVRHPQVPRSPLRFRYTRQQCSVVEDVTDTKLLFKYYFI